MPTQWLRVHPSHPERQGNVTVTGTAAVSSIALFLNSNAVARASIVTSAPAGITLIADSMSFIASTIISGLHRQPSAHDTGWQIDLGSAVDTTLGTLGLSNAELNSIAAAAINIGAQHRQHQCQRGSPCRWAPRQTLFLGRFTMTGGPISAGSVNQTTSGSADIAVQLPAGFNVPDGGSTGFGSSSIGTRRTFCSPSSARAFPA